MSNQDYTYPVTKETLHKYAESIFKPIIRGECVTTVWVPMAGRRKHNKFIIENIHLFEKELPNYDKYLLVYVEPLELTEETLSGYLRLMAKSFIEVCETHENCKNVLKPELVKAFDNHDLSYSATLEKLRNLLLTTTKTGHEVIFFVGEFDELLFANKIFFNNLKSLWSKLYPKLHYVFLVRERVTRQQNIEKWGELNEAVLQNVVYVPILDKADTDYMTSRLSFEFDVQPGSDQIKIIKELCGGHPYMLKVAFRILSQLSQTKSLEQSLEEHYELRSVMHGIINVRSEKEKNVLISVAMNGSVGSGDKDTVDFLANMGFIAQENGKYKLFSKLLEKELAESSKVTGKETGEISDGVLGLDENSGAVLFGGKSIEEKFTRQEYQVLTSLLKNDDKVCTRDDIGAILWGKESYEKYSDWAIDQLISKLRKKMLSIGICDQIATIRGKGYKFTH